MRSYITFGFGIQKNKNSNKVTNISSKNILNPIKRFGNFLKKEENKEIKKDIIQKLKTIQKKEEKYIRKDSTIEKKAVMIRSVNTFSNGQGSPFGVALKKIGSTK